MKNITTRGFRDKNDFVPKQFTLQVSPQAVYIVFDEQLDAFRSVSVIAKSALLPTSRPSVCIGEAPTGRISMELYIGDFMKICPDIPNLVINGQKIWYFT